MRKIIVILYFFVIALSYIQAQSGYSVTLRVEDLYWYQSKDDHLTSPEWKCDYYADLYLNGNLVTPSNSYTYEWYQDDTGSYIIEGHNQHHWNDGDAGVHYNIYVVVSGPGFSVTSSVFTTGIDGPVSKVNLSAKLQNGSNLSDDYFKLFTNPHWVQPQLGFFNITTDEVAPIKIEPYYLSTQKFNYWNETDEIINFYDYSASALTTQLNAQFKDRKTDIAIQKNFSEYPNSEILGFKDPWLVDELVSEDLGMRNRGMQEAPYKYYNSINFSSSSFDDYKGVFLNQLIEVGKPYYQIKIPTSINVGGTLHKINLLSYNTTNAQLQYPNQLETGVVFTNNNATVTANLKGSLLSNSVTAYGSGSQNKIVRVGNILCSVYESMGKIWMENSTDNGQTWTLLNNGHPLNSSNSAKNPSLSKIPSSDKIAVVYQEGNSVKVAVTKNTNVSNGNFIVYSNLISSSSGITSAHPVISAHLVPQETGGGDKSTQSVYEKLFVIVWQKNSSSSPGLYYKTMRENYQVNYTIDSTLHRINHTSSNSNNPTITSSVGSTDSNDFHFAWEERGSGGHTEIRYYRIHRS